MTIVAITKAASDALKVPYDPRRWPRTIHAELVDGLRQADVRAIVFDLWFAQERGEKDHVFAAAIEAAGTVVLLEFLEKSITGVAGSDAESLNAALHRSMPPVAQIAAAAVATAPFTLPKVPLQVAQFWNFDRNAGDAISLPLLALLVHARSTYPTLWRSVERAAPELAAQLPTPGEAPTEARAYAKAAEPLATALRQRPGLREQILHQTTEMGSAGTAQTDHPLLEAVLAALVDPPSRYLNFYGPPWTIQTISYDEAMRELSTVPPGAAAGSNAWSGRAVFVGLSSPFQWEQQDEFNTPYSDPETGHDLSGIEILATAFANLRDRTALQPLSPGFTLLLVLGWGLLVGLVARLITPLWAGIVVLSLSGAYFYTTLRLFTEMYLWLPLVTPLLVQTPLALFVATTMHYRAAKRDRIRIRELFGYYLPDAVVERLVREGFHPGEDRESVFGICLYSDAAQYTTLSEGMAPDALAAYMNAYYEVIFEPVRRHGGIISDVVGDAMMAIWAARCDDLVIRSSACHAALEILDAVERRSTSSDGPLLPTRIGLHCGTMTMAHVGAGDHFEYRAVGDIVNTASRLEALNKELGTSLLVSAETLKGVDAAVSRPLGSFVLAGKQTPIEVCELLGWNSAGRADLRS
jgi:adenylate cyclase